MEDFVNYLVIGFFGLLVGLLLTGILTLASAECVTSQNVAETQEKKEISTEVPQRLRGAHYVIEFADGTKEYAEAEDYKLVRRTQQFITTRVDHYEKKVCTQTQEKKLNRVNLLAGQGPLQGLDRRSSATTVEVESKVGATGGVQYQRAVGHDLNVGAAALLNQTVLVNIGLDF